MFALTEVGKLAFEGKLVVAECICGVFEVGDRFAKLEPLVKVGEFCLFRLLVQPELLMGIGTAVDFVPNPGLTTCMFTILLLLPGASSTRSTIVADFG